jgi:hypothetical protein
MSEPRTAEVVGDGRRLVTVVTEHEAGEQTAMVGAERTSATVAMRRRSALAHEYGPLGRSCRYTSRTSRRATTWR